MGVTAERRPGEGVPPPEEAIPDGGAGEQGGRQARGQRLLIAALLVLTAVFVGVRLSEPADGTATRAANPLPRGEDIEILDPRSGLRDGDVVVAIEGRPMVNRVIPDASPGEVLTYQVDRHGQHLDVDVRIGRYPWRTALAQNWASLLLVGSVLMVGAYVFIRRPEDAAARALLLTGALLACGSTYWVFPLQAIDLDGGPGWWANLGGGVAYVLVWPAMLHFALVFPEPHPVVRRHPGLLALPYVLPAVPYAVRAAEIRASATTPLEEAAAFVPTPGFAEYTFPALIVIAFSFAYRSAKDPATRTRLRWVAGSFTVGAVLYLALWKLPALLVGHPWGPDPLHLLVFLCCPIAIGVAILRVHLFDIDVTIRRSIVYAILTACVVGIYVLAVALLSRMFDQQVGWTGIGATVLVVLLISPLHRRLRRAVSQLVYGARDDPYEVVSRLGEQLEATVAPVDVLPRIVQTVAEALRLPYAAVELLWADGTHETATYGQLTGSPLVLPLTDRGELIGYLTVGERARGEGLGKRDRAVLDGLARQVSVAARAARFTLEVQRSRERLVTAREEERRRIRRDLHDGLGPSLAAAALQLQTARRLFDQDPATTRAILAEIGDQVQHAIADVRHVVDDLRPPSLDQLGLLGAIEEQALRFGVAGTGEGGGSPLRVDLQAEGDLRGLPAAVEVAAFRVVSEALTNSIRHGQARDCTVRLCNNGSLEVEVTDDGRGLPERYRSGVGLLSMRERAEELGGTFLVEALPSGGTRVWARLPLTQR